MSAVVQCPEVSQTRYYISEKYTNSLKVSIIIYKTELEPACNAEAGQKSGMEISGAFNPFCTMDCFESLVQPTVPLSEKCI